jgi:hypothetical protein
MQVPEWISNECNKGSASKYHHQNTRPKKDKGPPIDIDDPRPLYDACEKGDLETVSKMIQEKDSGMDYMGACLYACKGGHLYLVLYLRQEYYKRTSMPHHSTLSWCSIFSDGILCEKPDIAEYALKIILEQEKWQFKKTEWYTDKNHVHESVLAKILPLLEEHKVLNICKYLFKCVQCNSMTLFNTLLSKKDEQNNHQANMNEYLLAEKPNDGYKTIRKNVFHEPDKTPETPQVNDIGSKEFWNQVLVYACASKASAPFVTHALSQGADCFDDALWKAVQKNNLTVAKQMIELGGKGIGKCLSQIKHTWSSTRDLGLDQILVFIIDEKLHWEFGDALISLCNHSCFDTTFLKHVQALIPHCNIDSLAKALEGAHQIKSLPLIEILKMHIDKRSNEPLVINVPTV